MKIAIDADCNGKDLKDVLVGYLTGEGYDVHDLDFASGKEGIDYPDVAVNLANGIRERTFDKGILVCGTGQGMAIMANKVPGVYAGACSDIYAAERLCKSNSAQVIALGALVTGAESAKAIARVFVESEFQGGRSLPKVEKIRRYESLYARSENEKVGQ